MRAERTEQTGRECVLSTTSSSLQPEEILPQVKLPAHPTSQLSALCLWEGGRAWPQERAHSSSSPLDFSVVEVGEVRQGHGTERPILVIFQAIGGREDILL